MGCDIHEIIEKKQPDGTWKMVETPLNTWRSYDTFAMLANVRNGYGFAGCPTGAGFIPISPPKGLPSDLSIDPDSYDDDVPWLGDHSFSWLTLRELQEYDYDRETVKYGVVPEQYYLELKESGQRPESYSGGVSGWSIKTVSPVEMDEIIAGRKPRETIDPNTAGLAPFIAVKTKPEVARYYVQMEWPIKYRDSAGMILEHIIPAMEAIADGDPDSVRLVFGFDS